MPTSKGLRRGWGVAAVWAASLSIAGADLPGARADDVGVDNTAAPRPSNVRTAPPRPSYSRPRPAYPRPIQTRPTEAARPAPRRYVPAPRRRGQEQAVNLNTLTESTPSSRPAGETSMASLNPHGASNGGILPNFKFYFDFMLRSWKGSKSGESDFGFDTYHQRLLVEYTPTPKLEFQADLLSLTYFETDYMLTPRLQVRWGRIWIPFDDMSPHSMFGGRINTSEFFQGNETNFLPDIWADLGMGLKYSLADSLNFQSELHFYVVNGFHSGGTSPVQGEGTAVPYPNFGGTTGAIGDNNNQKAIGARWHSVFGRRFGLGVSGYRDTYTDSAYNNTDGKKALGIMILGIDGQLRPTNTTEIRAGYVTMKVDLDADVSNKESFSRGGTYVELGQRFGTDDRWKFLVRAGTSQNDNRVVDVSDKTIVGATLLKTFGNVEAQVNYYRDLHQIPLKSAYNYGEFRLVTAF